MKKQQLLPHLLQHTLQCFCSQQASPPWVYSVFWRILPRKYPPPKWDNEAGPPFDRRKGNKRNWILVWEDGYCDFVACSKDRVEATSQLDKDNEGGEEASTRSLQPELFFKMSHDIYNYGEGLMGKVAADNSYKWIFRDPCEQETPLPSPWQSSLDSYPRTWEAQFKAGIQTIAIVAVGEGLLQFGSTKKIMEDLNFVLMVQRRFNYLQSIPGVFAEYPSYKGSGLKREDDGQIENSTSKSRLDSYGGGQLDSTLSLRTTVVPSMSSLEMLLAKLPAVKGEGELPPPLLPPPNKRARLPQSQLKS